MTQVRASAQALIRFAKKSGAALILVGHVTKDGRSPDRAWSSIWSTRCSVSRAKARSSFRILRAVKNRFGPTDEIGVFEMTGLGLREVSNPSELFLSERHLGSPGTAVFAGLEGTRPVLVELQALVAPTSLGNAEACRCGLGSQPVVDGAGRARSPLRGETVRPRRVSQRRGRPAHSGTGCADLAAAAALISSLANAPLPPDAVYFGEISLSAAVRPVAQASARLKEAAKLGFRPRRGAGNSTRRCGRRCGLGADHGVVGSRRWWPILPRVGARKAQLPKKTPTPGPDLAVRTAKALMTLNVREVYTPRGLTYDEALRGAAYLRHLMEAACPRFAELGILYDRAD